MSITLTSRPFTKSVYKSKDIIELSLDPNDSPVLFTFESDVLNPSPSFSRLRINLYDNTIGAPPYYTPVSIVSGDTIEIFGEVFTASDNPAQNQFFTSSSVSTAQRARTVQSLADQINSNLNLNWRFNAQAFLDSVNNFYYVEISALQSGSINNFNIGSLTPNITTTWTNASSNISMYSGSVDATNQFYSEQLQDFDYSIFVEIWTTRQPQGWGSFASFSNAEKLADLSLSFNKTNEYRFDISNYIKTLTSIEIPFLNDLINQSAAVRTSFINNDNSTRPIRNYFLKYGEQFSGGINNTTGNLLFDSDNTYIRKYYQDQTEMRWTSRGVYDYNIANNNHSDYWDSSTISGSINSYREIKALTNQPANKLRRRLNLPELVYFYVYNDNLEILNKIYRVRNDFEDILGNITTTYTHLTNNFNTSNLFYIDLNTTKINFDAQDFISRIHYSQHTLEVSRNGGSSFENYSQLVSYEWDLNSEYFDFLNNEVKYFKIWWRNRLGVWDQFEFEGNKIKTVDANFEDYQKSFTYSNNLTNNGYFKNFAVDSRIKSDWTLELNLNTGLIDKNHLEWLRELINTTEVYIETSYLVLNTTTYNYSQVPQFLSAKLVAYEYNENYENSLHSLNITLISAIPENTLIN